MKYKLLDMKNAILQLEHPDFQEHKKYLVDIIDRNTTDFSFPSWMQISVIGDFAFYAHTNLESIDIPDGVTKIGWRAFDSCGLTSITIPGSVKEIDYGAFVNGALEDIYLYPIIPPTLADINTISTYITTIHVPIGSGDAYKTATNWSSFADKIVEDIEI